MKVATRTLQVKEIIRETPDTKSFVLECSDGNLEYKAGQFLTFLFTMRNGTEARRSYSISSSPDLNEPLTITVKRIANGEFSRHLIDRTKLGDELLTIGASGFFVLPQHIEDYDQLIFMAAGSGITPVYSLIKTVLFAHQSVKILLLYSNTNLHSAIFYDKLKAMQEKFPERLTIEFLFSRSPDLFRSRLTPESLEMFLWKHDISYVANTLYYICGPTDYMRMVTFRLISLGVEPGHIKKEIFHVQHPSIRPAPPDKDVHSVTLIRNDGHYRFSVQYPVTILQAAKLLDIHIPYSCESGQCGTCVARCLQGKVWMAHNEVLLDEEIRDGAVLTCTGYPVNGDVMLKI